jgi:hypothetical protein
MPTITIAGTPVEFPNSAASPNWAPEVIRFAQLVESALQGLVGPFDILPQFYTLTSAHNPSSGAVVISTFAFPTSGVRSFVALYDTYRQTDSLKVVESGTIYGNYNPDATIGNKWQFAVEKAGDASVTFTISDTGQVSFQTTTISGINHVGRINFRAWAFSQS